MHEAQTFVLSQQPVVNVKYNSVFLEISQLNQSLKING